MSEVGIMIFTTFTDSKYKTYDQFRKYDTLIWIKFTISMQNNYIYSISTIWNTMMFT